MCSNLSSLAVRLTHCLRRKVGPSRCSPTRAEPLCAQRRIYAIGPIHGAFDRPRRYDGRDRIFSMHPRPQAAPVPVLRARDQPGPHSIPLDVPQDGQQMFVALHREALEPSLTQMTIPDGPLPILQRIACVCASQRKKAVTWPSASGQRRSASGWTRHSRTGYGSGAAGALRS